MIKHRYLGLANRMLIGILYNQFLKRSDVTIHDIINVMEEGARQRLELSSLVVLPGIIVGVVTLTGIGLKMAGWND